MPAKVAISLVQVLYPVVVVVRIVAVMLAMAVATVAPLVNMAAAVLADTQAMAVLKALMGLAVEEQEVVLIVPHMEVLQEVVQGHLAKALVVVIVVTLAARAVVAEKVEP
jgi:hypothetical protein